MKISIVTAVLNGGPTLEATIHSVLSQADETLEYIVVDGGSTDYTLEILRGYGDRISWVSEPDEGISDAFNKGIARATGDVIGIISADDEMWPHAVEVVRQAFVAQPEADVVYGNAVYLEPDGRTIVSRPETDFRHVRWRTPLRHAAVFVRRSAYERWGAFDPAYRFAMDFELILRFHRQGARFAYVDYPLAAIRTGGISERRFRETIAESREISIRYGYSPVLAHARALESLARTYAKRALTWLGLTCIIDLYRERSTRFRSLEDERRPD